jgi:hypothetical protein
METYNGWPSHLALDFDSRFAEEIFDVRNLLANHGVTDSQLDAILRNYKRGALGNTREDATPNIETMRAIADRLEVIAWSSGGE